MGRGKDPTDGGMSLVRIEGVRGGFDAGERDAERKIVSWCRQLSVISVLGRRRVLEGCRNSTTHDGLEYRRKGPRAHPRASERHK